MDVRGKRVFFFDALEENLCDFISKFDYSLVTTLPVSKSTLYSMPNKLFESSIANVPIICSDTISASNFIKEYQKGEIYLSGNEYDLAVKIRSVTDNKEDYIYNQESQENFVKEFSQNEQLHAIAPTARSRRAPIPRGQFRKKKTISSSCCELTYDPEFFFLHTAENRRKSAGNAPRACAIRSGCSTPARDRERELSKS